MTTDMMKTASDRLAAIQKASGSQSVTISRRFNTVTAYATVGSTPFTIENLESGVVENFESRDYLIDAADYAPTGEASEPERGDQITETIGGETKTYEVMSPSGGPPFRYTDRYRNRLRVHTKLVCE